MPTPGGPIRRTPLWVSTNRALANSTISEMLPGVRVGDRQEHALARMCAREPEHALNQPNRADAAGGQRHVGPLFQGRADALTLADESIDKRLLTRGGLRLAGARRIQPVAHTGMDRDERVVGEDADQVRVPADADFLTQEREWHPIERAGDFDVTIGVHRPPAAGEIGKGLAREGLHRRLINDN